MGERAGWGASQNGRILIADKGGNDFDLVFYANNLRFVIDGGPPV